MRLDWKAILGIVVTILLLWWALRGVPVTEVWAQIRDGDLLLLSAAAIVAGAGLWVRAVRWEILLRPLVAGTSLRSRFGAVSVGFMANNVLPLRVGEFARAYALSRVEAVTASGAFGTLVVERALDGVVLLILLLAAMAWPTFPSGSDLGEGPLGAAITGATVLAAVVVGTMLVLFLFPRPFVRVARRVAALLPRTLGRLIVDVLEAFLEALEILRRPGLLGAAVAWTLGLWLFNSLTFWLGFRAFDIGLDYVAAVFTQAVVGFGVALPSAPGYIGTFHYAADLALSGVYGVDEARSLAFAFGLHAAGWIPVTGLGLWYAWRMGLGLEEMGRSEEEVELAVERRQPGSAGATEVQAAPRAPRGTSGVPGLVAGSVAISAPAKVNLVLRILDRDSGTDYHELETVFQAIDLVDQILIEPTETGELELEVVGEDLGPTAENLAWRAARAFLDEIDFADGLRVRLEKGVPVGAGLGGGSSDAAATLVALNALYGRPLTPLRLIRLGRALGADVPFFMGGAATALAWGRGDRLRGLPSLPTRPVMIVKPAFGISTREAYTVLARYREETGYTTRERELEKLMSIDWEWVAARHENDFETLLAAVHPELAQVRASLERTDPVLTLLSGSGSAMFAIYGTEDEAESAQRQAESEGWWTVRTRTLGSLPSPTMT